MKKIMFLFSLLAVMLSVNAQESATHDILLGYDQTWSTYTMPTGTNASTATDTTWYYTILKESKMPLKYDFKIKLDSIGGTYKTVPVVLRAKKFLSDGWTTIGTVYWVTGVDTVKTFTQITTAQQYRYWGIYIRANLKGFIYRIPELSVLFKEQ